MLEWNSQIRVDSVHVRGPHINITLIDKSHISKMSSARSRQSGIQNDEMTASPQIKNKSTKSKVGDNPFKLSQEV